MTHRRLFTRDARQSRANDVITVLAAPLVCSDFQHDFDIVSSPVFKDLGVIIKQGRGPGSKDYLSFCDSPDIKAEMGHRSNGLPILYLVPDSIVEDNRLRRMQHHSLTPYSDAEGIRLLKEQWKFVDNNGVYLAALDECYTTALLNGGPQRPIFPFRRGEHPPVLRPPGHAVRLPASDVSYGESLFIPASMLAQNEAAMKMRPVLPSDSSVCESPPSCDSLFERRSSGKEHACLKATYDVNGFEDVSESDELFYTWFHDPMPEFITPHAIGDKTASSDLHLHATSAAGAKKVDTPKFTVALPGSGLASELFFESLDT